MTDLCFVDVFIEEQGQIDVEVCKQGPQGPSGATQVNDTIAQGANKDVISVALSVTSAVMFIITVRDTAGLQRTAVVQATVIQNGTDVNWTRYGDIGDAVPFTEDLSIVVTDLVLNITNDHSVDFDISVLSIVTV
ncbi:MAG: hypothetical protein V3T23_02850 [Nitrososphaerales archaeon]